jgi:hypothetical protein
MPVHWLRKIKCLPAPLQPKKWTNKTKLLEYPLKIMHLVLSLDIFFLCWGSDLGQQYILCHYGYVSMKPNNHHTNLTKTTAVFKRTEWLNSLMYKTGISNGYFDQPSRHCFCMYVRQTVSMSVPLIILIHKRSYQQYSNVLLYKL